ncbi:MAG: hypothetical protein VZR27_08330 [Acutalibacteraceae bacterium]|nr:hypothetical protein [Acutalibacteraceae bacterium]
MIISINTEVLASVAALARSINEEICRISEIMQRVTIHDDWNCKERDTINDRITNNRLAQVKLQEMSDSFAGSVTSIADQFLEAERSLPNRFQHIDSIIGSSISVGGGLEKSGNISADRIRSLTSGVVLTDPMECYEVESVTDSINICSFDQIVN